MKTLAHEFLDIERECGFEVSQRSYQTLDDLLEKAKETIDVNADPRRILLTISEFLDKEFRTNGGLSHSLASECRGYAALSYSICERLGLSDKLSLVSAPSHVFVRWNDGKTKFNWNTKEKIEASDDRYRLGYNIHPNSIKNKVYLTELTREQSKAIAYDSCGVIKLKERDTDTAITCFDKAIKLNSKHVHSYCYRGHAKDRKRKYPEAIDDLNESIKLDPNYYRPYYYRGYIRLKQMKYAEANVDLTKSIELKPKHVKSYYYRADARLGIGDAAGAEQDNKIWRMFRR
jgi:tetratricopeptide (TPR) repeat protein